jgi:hypothetical protein
MRYDAHGLVCNWDSDKEPKPSRGVMSKGENIQQTAWVIFW